MGSRRGTSAACWFSWTRLGAALVLAAGCVGRDDEAEAISTYRLQVKQDMCCTGKSTPEALEEPHCAQLARLRLRLSAWNHHRFDDVAYAFCYQVATRLGLEGYPGEHELAEALRCPVGDPHSPQASVPPPPARGCPPDEALHMAPACMAACDPSCGVGRRGGVLDIICHPSGLSWSGAPPASNDPWSFTYQAARYRLFPNGFANLTAEMKRKMEALSSCLDQCCESGGAAAPDAPVVDASYATALASGNLLVPAMSDAFDATVFDGNQHAADGSTSRLVFLRFDTRAPLGDVMKFYEARFSKLGVPMVRCSKVTFCGLAHGADRLMAAEVQTKAGGFSVVEHPLGLTVSAVTTGTGTHVEVVWGSGGAPEKHSR